MTPINSLLVTGGTGSFGQAFVRHLLTGTDIERICVYSRGEHAQASMRQSIEPKYAHRVRWMIGDVRDLPRLRRAAEGVDAIVHAAALKRIEVGNYNPDEMVKTNILGTMNVIEAAVDAKVSKVVYLSSDKAFQPISPYGQSKALGESLILAANAMHGENGPVFVATRYGNVWASQGSVAPCWKALVEQGISTLPVSDLNCTRFFMHMREAVELVCDGLFHTKQGRLLIPDWLPAYRLGDLVQAFGCEPHVSGLPEWEKLHESMHANLCSADVRRLTIQELEDSINEL